MAVGDIQYSFGKPVRVLSSGTAPTIYFYFGKPIILHEYIGSGGATIVPIIDHHYQLMGMM
jgi:hypothetical protein